MITLKDIAAIANVSTSTASRALNDDPRISPEQKLRIQRIAEEQNYNKHKIRKPEERREDIWKDAGIIVPEINSGYYSNLVHIASDQFARQHYSVLLRLSGFDTDTLIRHIFGFEKADIRCVLIVADDAEQITEEVYQALRRTRIPAMFITTQYNPHMDYDSIYVDETRGIRAGVEYLTGRGYSRIGFIGEEMTRGRLNAFRQVMHEIGNPVREDLIRTSAARAEEGGYQCMKQMLEAPEHPDAIFAGYDQMAVGALKAIDEAGLRVPEDIGIMGFDNIIMSGYIHKGLTTIENPLEDMIAIAVRVLMNRMQNEDAVPQQIALKPALVIRETT